MKTTLLLACLLTGFISGTSVADKIIQFSLKNLGKKVDRGECWDLANAALNDAGAQWTAPFNYGDKIDIKKQGLKPADVLQFTSVKFEMPNGTMSFPQHTAIVYKANKSLVTVFHQNFNGKRYVDTLTLNLEYLDSGTIDAYRPK